MFPPIGATSSLLLCFAHPDDETIFAAGLMCAASAAGRPVVLVTGTRGEAGRTGDPPVCEPHELGATRERELREAAAIVGVTDLRVLGYPDRALAAAPIDEVRATLVEVIRGHRPSVIVSFDPHGTNQHTDHVAISRFTSDAVAVASDPRWFPELGDAHVVSRLLWVPRRQWETLRSGNPAVKPGVDFLVDVRPWTVRKAAALRAHRSQHLSTERIFFNHPDQPLTLGFEIFRQAWGPPLRSRPSDDVFAD